MENQKKNQTFPKKQNPANFFKDNITEKMKNYFPEEGNSGITMLFSHAIFIFY